MKLVTAFALFGAMQSCVDPCENEVLSAQTSPSGAWTAYLFQRSCGATTGYTSQVSLVRNGEELPARKGNAFIADADRDDVILGQWGGPYTDIRWIGPHSLEIRHDPLARVSRSEARVEGVEITYRAGVVD